MTEFIQRPIWMTDYAPGFLIPGKRGRKMAKTDALISLPMYAKYAKLRLDQIPMIRLLIDMHEPSNKTHVKFLKDAMQTLLDNEGLKDQYTTFAYQDVLDNSSKVSNHILPVKFKANHLSLLLGHAYVRDDIQRCHFNYDVHLLLLTVIVNDRQSIRASERDISDALYRIP